MAIEPIQGLRPAVLYEQAIAGATTAPAEDAGASFATSLERASAALRQADESAVLVAAGRGDIAGAAVERAKADVMLEVAAVTASRISGAVTTLLQTQV